MNEKSMIHLYMYIRRSLFYSVLYLCVLLCLYKYMYVNMENYFKAAFMNISLLHCMDVSWDSSSLDRSDNEGYILKSDNCGCGTNKSSLKNL